MQMLLLFDQLHLKVAVQIDLKVISWSWCHDRWPVFIWGWSVWGSSCEIGDLFSSRAPL